MTVQLKDCSNNRLNKKIAALEAERDRMRKALEAINSMPTGSTSRIPHAMQEIAKNALKRA